MRRMLAIILGFAIAGAVAIGFSVTRERGAVRGADRSGAVARTVPQPISPRTSPESVRRVSTTRLREQIERGEVVVIDVRDIDAYTAGHIPGAMHIPLSYIESELPYLPRAKPIVTYCT